mmetsp:Transcript_7895/g.15806  ORF Transcript_7895/g.15806 Transcript_7895/m.15806 type:complete len:282 (+) Transcript_7895:374-1219(+)
MIGVTMCAKVALRRVTQEQFIVEVVILVRFCPLRAFRLTRIRGCKRGRRAVAVSLSIGDLGAALSLPALPPALLDGGAITLHPRDPVVIGSGLLPEHVGGDDGRSNAVSVVANDKGAEGRGKDELRALLNAIVLRAAYEGDFAIPRTKLGLHHLKGLVVYGVGTDQEQAAVVVEHGLVGELGLGGVTLAAGPGGGGGRGRVGCTHDGWRLIPVVEVLRETALEGAQVQLSSLSYTVIIPLYLVLLDGLEHRVGGRYPAIGHTVRQGGEVLEAQDLAAPRHC